MTKRLFGTKSGYRDITVNGRDFRWKAGRQYIDIRDATDNTRVSPAQLTTWQVAACGPNDDHSVTPQMIADYIKHFMLK